MISYIIFGLNIVVFLYKKIEEMIRNLIMNIENPETKTSTVFYDGLAIEFETSCS